ncbi:predicted protein, partial [Nematostella vectensis]
HSFLGLFLGLFLRLFIHSLIFICKRVYLPVRVYVSVIEGLPPSQSVCVYDRWFTSQSECMCL